MTTIDSPARRLSLRLPIGRGPGYRVRPMDERERRLAKNESVFRAVNERIEQVAGAHGTDQHEFAFFCECSNADCTLQLRLTLAAYESARRDPAVFVVAPGHELPQIEEVLQRTAGYQLVRKHGEAAELAEELDPRS
jgi:hypothetical protein